MTQIKHHLTDALLMGYAAGNLPEAFNLVVATHISMCDDCRAALAAYDAVGGSLIEAADPCDLAEDALEATLAKIVGDRPKITPKAPVPANDGLFPRPLQDYLRGDVETVNWRHVAGGVSQLILPTANDATVRLLKIPAGAAMPDHGHRGTELTLVLQGAFLDESDRFGVGDVEVADEATNHTPIAANGPDCICLAATDAPLQFKGIVPKIAQRFFRI